MPAYIKNKTMFFVEGFKLKVKTIESNKMVQSFQVKQLLGQ